MKISDLKKHIISRHQKKIKRPVLIEAAPGVGKTQIVAQIAQELKIDFQSIHAPLLQPEDYGFPVINSDRNDVSFIVSKQKFPIVGSKYKNEGLLLIDELSQCDNSSQKILANLCQEREIHGQKLLDKWTIVATGNRTTDRAGANRILSHLSNRVTRISLEVSIDDWTNWALNNNIHTELIAFLRFRPELLCKFDSHQEINPTPRAWSEGINSYIGQVDKSNEFEVFSGDVGEGPAAEFCAFLKIFRNLPSVDVILLNPANADLPTDPATQYALCGALARRSTKDNFNMILKYIERMPPEFTVLFVKESIRNNPDIQNSKEFISWASNQGNKLLI